MHLFFFNKNINWYFNKSNIYYYDSFNFKRQLVTKYFRFSFIHKNKIETETTFEIFLFLFFFTHLNTNIFKKNVKFDINKKKKKRKFTKKSIQFLGLSWHLIPKNTNNYSKFFYELFMSFDILNFIFYKPIPLLSPLKIIINNIKIKKKTTKLKIWKKNNLHILRNKFTNFIFKNNSISYFLFYRARKDDFFLKPIANFFKKYNYIVQFSLKKHKNNLNILNNYKFINNYFYYFIKSNYIKILFLNNNCLIQLNKKHSIIKKKKFFYF